MTKHTKAPTHVAYLTLWVGLPGYPGSRTAGYQDEEIIACGSEDYCRRLGHRIERITGRIPLHCIAVRDGVAHYLARYDLVWLPADSLSRRGALRHIPATGG